MTSYPPARTLIMRGLRRRCPWCGSRSISRHVAAVEVHCPNCGLFLERQPGSFIGGIGLNTIVSFIAVLAIIGGGFVWTRGEASVIGILLPAVVVGFGLPLWFYARSRLTWVAFELIFWPLTEEEQFAASIYERK